MSDAIEEAAEVRSDLIRNADEVLASDDLSSRGKQRQLDELHAEAVEKMRKLQEQHQAALTQDRDAIVRKAFGAPSGRDTEYRSTLVSLGSTVTTPAQAVDQLRLAEQVGDDLLARAVAAVAYDRGWGAALDAYAANFDGDALAELREFDRANNLRARIARSMHFSLTRPKVRE